MLTNYFVRRLVLSRKTLFMLFPNIEEIRFFISLFNIIVDMFTSGDNTDTMCGVFETPYKL